MDTPVSQRMWHLASFGNPWLRNWEACSTHGSLNGWQQATSPGNGGKDGWFSFQSQTRRSPNPKLFDPLPCRHHFRRPSCPCLFTKPKGTLFVLLHGFHNLPTCLAEAPGKPFPVSKLTPGQFKHFTTNGAMRPAKYRYQGRKNPWSLEDVNYFLT